MKFKCEANEFYQALQKVFGVTSGSKIVARPTLLEIREGWGYVSSSSHYVYAKASFPLLDNIEEGETCIQAFHLKSLLALTEGEITFVEEKGFLSSPKIKIPLLPLESRPVEFVPDDTATWLSGIDLSPLVVFDAESGDIEFEENSAKANSFGSGGCCIFPVSLCHEDRLCLPGDVLRAVKGEGQIAITAKRFWYREGDFQFSSVWTANSTFLPLEVWQKIIAETKADQDKRLLLGAKVLRPYLSSLGQAFSYSGHSPVQLVYEGEGYLEIRSPRSQLGEAVFEVPTEGGGGGGERFSVYVSARFLNQAFSAFESQVYLYWHQERGMLVLSDEEVNIIHCVMKMITQEVETRGKEALDAQAKEMAGQTGSIPF